MNFMGKIMSVVQLRKNELDILPTPENSDIEFFTSEFLNNLEECQAKNENALQQIYENINIGYIADVLRDKLAGCCEQCVFCNEQCKYDKKHSVDHSCTLHHPQCLGGWQDSVSGEMTLESCTELLADDRSFYPPGSSSTMRYRDYCNVNDQYHK